MCVHTFEDNRKSNLSVHFSPNSWRPSVHVSDNLNWFEISDLAPVIDNEAYLATNEDLLEAGRSGLLQNDTIEPLPRERENILYQSDDSDVIPAHQLLSRSSVKQEDEHFYHVLDENQPPQHRIPLTTHPSHSSHTYEEIRGKKMHLIFKSIQVV